MNNIKKILTELDKISKLQDNWDGFNADAVSSKCVEHTKKIISNLQDNTLMIEIYPTPNGTIVLDWNNKYLLNIECGDDTYSVSWMDTNDIMKCETGVFKTKKSQEKIHSLINKFNV